ncbi:glycosyltransferase family 2 protein [Bradyrhizobium yuanmingense]|uniref:glycosyltransferase family 2 protein n=1 Tax=Bradyrhizobium yuanmingense TaxID=108015 RepID=UPI0023BA3C69|nr:glycosyltransferase family 2 protein [Bradyrhizobium yuanmingense]MDF0516828.1 glycosyltransferase family 2 protein [Bradyrhizobium yuanmingense]
MNHHTSLSETVRQNSKIIVVIPTLNEERTIVAVIASLAREKARLTNLQIIVADGGSADRTVTLAKEQGEIFPFVKVINNPKRLQSAAVNLVARQWRNEADVLVRCDAHAHYPERFVEQLLTTLINTGADSVVVPMDSIGRDCLEKAVAWVSDTPLGSGGSAHRGGKRSGLVDHGHHAAFRLSSFLDNGGYDETFSHNEDAEFDCRLNARGGKVFLDANIRLEYHPRSTFRSLARQYFNYGKGRSRTVRRHPHAMRLRQIVVPAHFVLTIVSLLVALIAGSWLALAWPLLYLAALTAMSLLLAFKHKSVCGLLAGSAAACMHFSWASGFFWGFINIREQRWLPMKTAA